MAEHVISPGAPGGAPPPDSVSAEEYMAQYAHDFYEWEDGRLVRVTPIHLIHDKLTAYLRALLEAYFAFRPIGQVVAQPFVMRLDTPNTYREPDLQVILNTNPGEFTPTAMIGAADICIEVVSPESADRDYGKKFLEYEKAGVTEYWIIDPARKAARFNRLNTDGIYADAAIDAAGEYLTPLLPGLKLNVRVLWQDPLPDIVRIVESVREMLGGTG